MKKSCSSAGLEPMLVTTTTSGRHLVAELFILWFFNGMQLNFCLHQHLQQPVVDKPKQLEACLQHFIYLCIA